jgi:methionyl-tRNA formyltransferase
MQMDAGLDTGPVLLQQSVDIAPGDDAQTLHDRLAILGSNLLEQVLVKLKSQSDNLVGEPQDFTRASYAPKISKAEAELDFTLPAEVLANKVRAFNPFPGAQTTRGSTTIKIWRATALLDSSAEQAGKIIAANAKEGVLVACGSGVLRIDEMQKAGGKRMRAVEFIKGFPLDHEQ